MSNNLFDKQAAIDSALENGILNIGKLLKCNDFETIKEGLNNYPLTINEYLIGKYNQGDYRAVFQCAVDNKMKRIADYLITGKMPLLCYGLRSSEATFGDLVDYEISDLRRKGASFVNDSYFYTKKRNNGYNAPIKQNTINEGAMCLPHRKSRQNASIKPNVTKEEVVNEIIRDISLKLDKETITAGLTREYFEDLYNKGNFELLVIKLCVRLEAILKCDFHYEGTFEEMLTRYSKEHGYKRVDDEWGNHLKIETEQNEIFHKLRRYRNNIVHAENNQETLSADEIELAIEYVFKLG